MRTTKAVIVAVALILAAYEALVIALGIPQATISEAVWDWSSRYPYLPFAAGILCGHLFWREAKSNKQ